MSTWRKPDKWERWIRGDGCPICRNVADAPGVAELEVSRLMVSEDAPMRGYAWMPFRRHVIERGAIRYFDCAALSGEVRQIIRARRWLFARPVNATMARWSLGGSG